MALTPEQQVTLKADINANPELAAQPMTSAGALYIIDYYNVSASPAFTAWKTNVGVSQIGDKFNGAELAGLTTGNQTRLQVIALYSPGGVNPSLPDRRAFFDDIFSGAGGAVTRANLLALWKRTTTRAEKLFSTGTGSDAVPATLTFEGLLTTGEVQQARES
jgi:hypothetical protein